ncbi:MAG: hypothetical protein A2W31_04935 [Planctomycetes bacterium RBG_16_64_10]|nr:MAG: hypothetical protein A2W31_04935 [Planctomycetes bacterium RBG_16_64_10]
MFELWGDNTMAPSQTANCPRAIDTDELLGRCLGNLQFAEWILSVFEQRGTIDLADLEQAIEERDLVRVAAISHRLKGACANISAYDLTQRIGQLREAACAEDLVEVAEQYHELTNNWADFLAARADLNWGTDVAEPPSVASD